MALDLYALFEKHAGEQGKFKHIKKPRHRRPDLCAFLMLDEIVPDTDDGKDIISAAGNDEIHLAIDCARLAEEATEGQIIDLIRCGVSYSVSFDSLCMSV